MIRLTGKSGIEIYVNPEMIIGVEEEVNYSGTYINYGEDSYIVTESPEEVAKKVLDYKLAMIQYQTYLAKETDKGCWKPTKKVRSLLKRLAGLEETNE